MNTDRDSAYLVISVVGQIGLAAYVYWCVRRGFIWLHMERVERKKSPKRFKMVLGSYVVFEILLGLFTLYQLLQMYLRGSH